MKQAANASKEGDGWKLFLDVLGNKARIDQVECGALSSLQPVVLDGRRNVRCISGTSSAASTECLQSV